ncbi:hypothetical protein [Erythrobacter rubeus]|uniref:AcrB/AcrD/AcrF family protein n=1 Tax=Erythrobacter rubeus TaxID=2760803 RepID=A0ABR8KXX8_9SPHN|nr:hypothetical protein [Erythrobacter rubeus]MBD2843087.1 hypothetical protein [Erythrobacter rubeus]
MLVERRGNALPIEFLARVGIAWAVVCCLLMVVHWSLIASGRFPDPDDMLRLVQVRDLLAGQNWFDLHQYRIDAAGGGVAMHWSRLVDIPLALVIFVLTPIVGTAAAETAALVIVPLLTLLTAMLLAARIAWKLLGDEEATLTSLILVISIPVLFQLSPMRIDHHGWQIVCALAAVNGLMARSKCAGGWTVGASLAMWLSISMEGLPLAAAIFAVLAWRWLKDRGERQWLVSAIQSFTVIGGALFLATRGIGDLVSYCDAISPWHLAMFAWGAVVLTVLAKMEPLPRGMVFAGFVVAGGGALATMFAVAPQCATGGFADLDPVVAENWHQYVSEGMPMWRQTLPVALQYVVTPLIGLVAALNLARQSHDWLRRFWFDYALILGAALLVSLLVARAGAVACVLAAPPLAWQVRSWLRSIRAMKKPAPRVAAMVAVACALLPTFPLVLLTNAMPAQASLGNGRIAAIVPEPPKPATCEVKDVAPQLRTLEQGEFYALMDIAPHLLLTTEHSVVATGHHRGDESMKVLIETALGSSDEARDVLSERGTKYVMICPSLDELEIYSKLAPDGFASELREGTAPEWLQPIKLDGETGLKVWAVQ